MKPKRLRNKQIDPKVSPEQAVEAKAQAFEMIAAWIGRSTIDLGFTPDPQSWALIGALTGLASEYATVRWPDATDEVRIAALVMAAQSERLNTPVPQSNGVTP